MDTPVGCGQNERELEWALERYRRLAPPRVLEVGTYLGGSLYHWLQNAPAGAIVVSVDTYDEADNSILYPSWCPEGVRCEVIRGDSHDMATVQEASRFAPYGWIFIDAGHLEADVRADWEWYGPLCAPGGCVVFHDIARDSGFPRLEVWKLWEELRESYITDEIILATGIGIVAIPVS